MGNVHVTNKTSRTLRVYVAQRKFVIKELVLDTKLSPIPLEGMHRPEANTDVQATVDYNLNTEGYACLAPGKSLEFAYHIQRGDVYISAVAGDVTSAPPVVACHNYSPPPGRSVVIVEDAGGSSPVMSVVLGDQVDALYQRGTRMLVVGTVLLVSYLFLAVLHPLGLFVHDQIGKFSFASIFEWFVKK